MIIVTKQDFADWKNSPVTKAVFKELQLRIDVLKDELAQTAGLDPLEDRKRSIYIQACTDFINTELEAIND